MLINSLLIKIATLFSVATLSLFLSSCSNIPLIGDSYATDVDSDLVFIDLDTFDSSLSKNMQVRTDLVTVRFPNQPVTVNDLPNRMAKWLVAVDRHGGGVTVQTKEGYIQKDMMGLISIVMSGYKLAKDSLPIVLGRKYGAIIIVNPADGVIERVEFARG